MSQDLLDIANMLEQEAYRIRSKINQQYSAYKLWRAKQIVKVNFASEPTEYYYEEFVIEQVEEPKTDNLYEPLILVRSISNPNFYIKVNSQALTLIEDPN